MEELRRLKQETGMTNQQIADASGVPLGTVNRVLAGRAKNPAYSTVSAMRDAVSAEEQSSEHPPVPACEHCSCTRDMPNGADFQRISDNFMEMNFRADASFAEALASKDGQFEKERLFYEKQLRGAHRWLVALSSLLIFFFLTILALCIYNVVNFTRSSFAAYQHDVRSSFFV